MVDVSAKAADRARGRGRRPRGDARVKRSTSCARATRKKATCSASRASPAFMAAKRTHELIPLCHPLPISQIEVDIAPDAKLPGIVVKARVKVAGKTGVEMEALTAVSVACLTIYDMVKAVERGMRIEGIRLIEKRGGRSPAIIACGSNIVALLSVAEALDQVLAHAAPLPAEKVAARRGLWPRARGRSQGVAHTAARRRFGDGRLCRARRRRRQGSGAPESHRRSRGRPAVRCGGRLRRGSADLHRRLRARRRRYGRDPGTNHARRRQRRGAKAVGQGPQCARRKGSISAPTRCCSPPAIASRRAICSSPPG